jgi:ADP-ribosylglycohydrolase
LKRETVAFREKCSHEWPHLLLRSEIHTAHATHAAHAAATAAVAVAVALVILRRFGDHRFGGDHQASG